MQRRTLDESNSVLRALANYPYFITRNEVRNKGTAYNLELQNIQWYYNIYEKGKSFVPQNNGDNVSSSLRFKQIRTLINKEARFMFSQTPDVNVLSTESNVSEKLKQYQKIVDKVIEKNKFSKKLIEGAKDCLIGKRIACLIDYSVEQGIQLHFYDSLHFYYELNTGNNLADVFICWEYLTNSDSLIQQEILVNRYDVENDKVYMSSVLYDGTGKEMEQIISRKEIDLPYIPVEIITNDELLKDNRGVSEIKELEEYEESYSKLSNADIDSNGKGMNPIYYVVDMNGNTTKKLSLGAGAFWDLKTDQMQDNMSPQVGVLAPALNHTEPVKTTLERIKTMMYSEVDMPDISQEGLLSGITSFKALKALYYPLMVRCDEKMITWIPSLTRIFNIVLELALLNKNEVVSFYELSSLEEIQYSVKVVENYALLDDEEEEKTLDMEEVNLDIRSRASYNRKWRRDELETDEQIEKELMQIAKEKNMLDTMSLNAMVQSELEEDETQREINKTIEDETIKQQLDDDKTKTNETKIIEEN